MTTNVQTAAGTTLYIGGTGALESESSWVEVGEVVDMGEYGKTYNLITHNPISSRKTYKFKGSYNEGAISLQLGQDIDDTGQDNIRTALASDDAYNFKIEHSDVADTSGSTPTTDTFKGMVMSWVTQIGSVDSIVGASCQIEISGDITRVDHVDA